MKLNAIMRQTRYSVLLSGWSILFVRPEGMSLEAVDMEPGVFITFPKGIWHNLVASRDAAFLNCRKSRYTFE